MRPPAETFKLDPAAVQWRLVEDEILALDLHNSRYLAINRTGKHLWLLLVRGCSVPEMCHELVRTWAIEPGAAERDVGAFMARLRSQGLLLALDQPEEG